jgi:putative membrane protein
MARSRSLLAPRPVASRALALLAALAPALAAAHAGEEPAVARWNPDPWVLVPLAAAALLYAAGRAALALRGRRDAVRAHEAAAFALGLAALVAALVSPIDRLAERLFAVHMGQHELLMLVAAPLVVVGRPLVPFLCALPARWQPKAIAAARRPAVRAGWAFLTAPLVAVVLHAAARWVWHLPLLFDAALEHPHLHAVQHLTFFLTAVLFWWSVVHGRYGRAGYGVSVLAVFLTAAHTGLLGAIVTLAPAPLYETYARLLGADALADQQVAGLVMWVPAGVLLALVGLALFAAWLGESSRRTRGEAA